MLKRGILFILLFVVGTRPSYGALGGGGATCCTSMGQTSGQISGCASGQYQYNCDNAQIFYTCDSCNYGYTRYKVLTKTLCSGGSIDFYTCLKCTAGQYVQDAQCKNCPSPGTSASGYGSITDCYKAESSTTSSDTTGSYKITYPKCYYTE